METSSAHGSSKGLKLLPSEVGVVPTKPAEGLDPTPIARVKTDRLILGANPSNVEEELKIADAGLPYNYFSICTL